MLQSVTQLCERAHGNQAVSSQSPSSRGFDETNCGATKRPFPTPSPSAV